MGNSDIHASGDAGAGTRLHSVAGVTGTARAHQVLKLGVAITTGTGVSDTVPKLEAADSGPCIGGCSWIIAMTLHLVM